MAGTDRTAAKNIVLEPEHVIAIRRALGLSSFGELERVTNQYEVHVGISKKEIPSDLRPLHPTGAPDTSSDFAEALSFLEYAAEAPS